jgi:NTP pyrophosphatase (non-canonical NTP hydrolase)
MSFNACKNEPGAKLEVCDRFNHKTNLTANEYQELAARTINQDLDIAELEAHAFCGMVSEIGELSSIYQKAYQGHTPDPEHAKKELGDLLWFIAEYCTAAGWTLEEVMIGNIEKLYGRYPDGFDADHSLNRAEGDI